VAAEAEEASDDVVMDIAVRSVCSQPSERAFDAIFYKSSPSPLSRNQKINQPWSGGKPSITVLVNPQRELAGVSTRSAV